MLKPHPPRTLRLPADARLVNSRVWYRELDGVRSVFQDETFLYSYAVGDVVQHSCCAAQLVEAGLATFGEVCRAFEISKRTFCRIRTKLRHGGIAALVLGKRGPKSRQRKTVALTAAIVQMYRAGGSTYDIAVQCGLSPSTVARVLKEAGVRLRGAGHREGGRPEVS